MGLKASMRATCMFSSSFAISVSIWCM
jgi:hypothetical protein